MTTSRTSRFGLAALVVCALPTMVHAETFGFTNDCKVAIVVQVATVQRGVLKREQSLLKAGEATPTLLLDTDKMISITDARTGRLLFREALRVSKTPRHFSILPDPRGAMRVVMKPVPPPKAEMPPMSPPAGRSGAK